VTSEAWVLSGNPPVRCDCGQSSRALVGWNPAGTSNTQRHVWIPGM